MFTVYSMVNQFMAIERGKESERLGSFYSYDLVNHAVYSMVDKG
jgi:hypothetical protein